MPFPFFDQPQNTFILLKIILKFSVFLRFQWAIIGWAIIRWADVGIIGAVVCRSCEQLSVWKNGKGGQLTDWGKNGWAVDVVGNSWRNGHCCRSWGKQPSNGQLMCGQMTLHHIRRLNFSVRNKRSHRKWLEKKTWKTYLHWKVLRYLERTCTKPVQNWQILEEEVCQTPELWRVMTSSSMLQKHLQHLEAHCHPLNRLSDMSIPEGSKEYKCPLGTRNLTGILSLRQWQMP